MTASRADTFRCFPSLPPELRRIVWRHTWRPRAVELSRVIVGARPSEEDLERWAQHILNQVWCDTQVLHGVSCNRYQESFSGYTPVKTITTTTTKPPISLLINSESRAETLRHYRLAFASLGSESRVYFNFALDWLVLRSHVNPFLVASLSDLQKLENVLLPATQADSNYHATMAHRGYHYLHSIGRYPTSALVAKREDVRTIALCIMKCFCPNLRQLVLLSGRRCGLRAHGCRMCSKWHQTDSPAVEEFRRLAEDNPDFCTIHHRYQSGKLTILSNRWDDSLLSYTGSSDKAFSFEVYAIQLYKSLGHLFLPLALELRKMAPEGSTQPKSLLQGLEF